MGATKLEFLDLRDQEAQKTEQGLTFELRSLLHADKATISDLSKHLVDRVATGEVDAYKAYIHAKKINELSGAIEKNLRPYVNSKGIPRTGLVMYNIEFKAKSDPKKYDYSGCEDIVYTRLLAELEKAKEAVKKRETFLQTLDKPKTEIDEDTGEFYTINPPIVTLGAENFAASIK